MASRCPALGLFLSCLALLRPRQTCLHHPAGASSCETGGVTEAGTTTWTPLPPLLCRKNALTRLPPPGTHERRSAHHVPARQRGFCPSRWLRHASGSPDAGDDPVNSRDPSGLANVGSYTETECELYNGDKWVSDSSTPGGGHCVPVPNKPWIASAIGTVGDGFATGWNETGGVTVHWVKENPKVAIGIGLGIIALGTGGIGLGADLAFEGTALTTTLVDTTAVVAGSGAAYLDTSKCLSGDNVACIAAGLGISGAAGAVPALVGDLIGVEANTLPFAVINGASAFGFVSGTAATVFDPFAADAASAEACP